VRDVARAETGRRQYIDDNRFNGSFTSQSSIYQQPGPPNGLDVSKQVRATMEELKKSDGRRVSTT